MPAIVASSPLFKLPFRARSFLRQSGETLACERVFTSQFLAVTHGKNSFDSCRLLSGRCTSRDRVPNPVFSVSGLNSSVDSGELAESVEVVAEILEEIGASKEEACRIASTCPAYIKTLVGNVRELDESRLWETWQREEGNLEGLNFKKKVGYIVKGKGDDGLIPFLESIGLKASSCTYVARYLSGKIGLVELVEKVSLVKEVLFPDRVSLKLIGRNARRMMKHFSVSADDDIQKTLSYFQKMEARRGGLDLLDQEDAAFPCLVESFPRLLLLSVDTNIRPLMQFLRDIGVSKEMTGVVLLLFPPIIFYNIEKDIIPRLRFFEKVSVEGKEIGRLVVKYPWVLCTSVQENYGEVLSLLTFQMVPKATVDGAITRCPHVLGCSTGRLESVLKLFTDMGVKSRGLVHIFSSSPQLLLRRPQELLKVVAFMEQFGLDDRGVRKVLFRCPEVFAANIENTLKEKIKYITELGIPKDNFPRIMRKYPEFLVCSVSNALKPRMDYLTKVGMTREEIASVVFRFSPVLGYSIEEVLKPKLEFLVYVMDKPITEVVDYPRYFSYSLEKRIKPRFWVLKSRNMRCSLRDMLGKNEEEFAAEYMGIGRMLIPPASF